MNPEEINELELLGHNAWVAQERMRIGGWLLRADNGVTRRANSVLPLGPPGLDVSTAIEFVNEFYSSRDLIPRFQVSDASLPADLDSILDDQGFSKVFHVEVWTAEISALLQLRPLCETQYLNEISDEWIDTFLQSSGHDPATMSVRKDIMERTDQPSVFVQSNGADSIDAVGYGVVEGSWLGIFSIGTLPEKRKTGAATAINHALGIWGSKLGATRVYLQVETNNNIAKNLYRKIGFAHAYTYWYRQLDSVKKEKIAASDNLQHDDC
ncbi:MAG: GNAT family N-acetyltransferase [Candidatus Thorarchaeota archaeon]|nr:MAG: GNAT family N-acetyltransferase [Candidatus Thorarchaeota archaeon]